MDVAKRFGWSRALVAFAVAACGGATSTLDVGALAQESSDSGSSASRSSASDSSVASSVSSSSVSGGNDVTNFTGTTWIGTVDVTATCDGTSATSSGAYDVAFLAEAGGITFTSSDGCVFDFSVSDGTATLSNGPVTCSAITSTGAVEQVLFSQYTLTTADGLTLSGTTSGTTIVGGMTCTFDGTVNASR